MNKLRYVYNLSSKEVILNELHAAEESEIDCHKLAKNLHKIYKPVDIPSKDECLTKLLNLLGCKTDVKLIDEPQITTISTMCHCCT